MEPDFSASINVAKSHYSSLKSEPDVQIISDDVGSLISTPNIRNFGATESLLNNSSLNSSEIFSELQDRTQLTTGNQIVHSEAIIKNMISVPTSANLFADITSGLSPALCEQLKTALNGSNDFYGLDFSNCDINLFSKDCEMSNTDRDSNGMKPSEREVSTEFGENISTNDNNSDLASESNKITGEFILTNFQDEDYDSLDSDQFLRQNKLSLEEAPPNTNMVNSNLYATNSSNLYSESARKFEMLNSITSDFNRNIASESQLNFRNDHCISRDSGFRLSDDVKFNSGGRINRSNVENLNEPTIQYCAEKCVDSVLKSSCVEKNITDTQCKVSQNDSDVIKHGNVLFFDSALTEKTMIAHDNLMYKVNKQCNGKSAEGNRVSASAENLSCKHGSARYSPSTISSPTRESACQNETLYKCRKCNALFHTIEQRNLHEEVHVSEYPFRCIVCNERFISLQSLVFHQHLHSNVQPVCDKEIMTPADKFEASSINLIETQILPTKSSSLHCETRRGETLSEKEVDYELDLCKENFHTQQTLEHGLYFDYNKGFIDLVSRTDFHETLASGIVPPSTRAPPRITVQAVQNNFNCEMNISPSANVDGEANSITDLYHAITCTYKCEDCNKTFSVKEEFRNHLIEHFKRCVLKCDHCKEFFATVVELKSHEEEHFRRMSDTGGVYPDVKATNVGVQSENRCGKTFEEGKLVSDLCGKKRQRKDEGMDACQTCLSKNCGLCGEKLSSAKKLKQHYKKHNSERSYSCSICKKSFATLKERNNHMKVRRGNGGPRVLMSGKERTSNSEMETDAITGKENSDRYINESSLKDQNCDVHLQKKNLNDKENASVSELEIPPEPKKPSYDCAKCGRRCRSETGLKNHEAVHTKQPVSCIVCGKNLMVRRIVEHSKHSYPDERFYKCFQCKRNFSNIKDQNLKEPQFNCNFCNKAFYCQKILDQHLKMHETVHQFGNWRASNSFFNPLGYAQNFHPNYFYAVPYFLQKNPP